MEKISKNLIIILLFITSTVFGFMWYSQKQQLVPQSTIVQETMQSHDKEMEYSKENSAKIMNITEEDNTTSNEDEKINAYFDQIQEDVRVVDTWQKLKCIPKTRLDCDGTNCTQSQPVVYLILNRTNETYARCDTKGCDTYDANFDSGGIYTNIQPRNPSGMMIKVLGNREYIEMATIGLSTVFQHGSCVESP